MSKTVIITGASSGIGEALAYEAASRGHKVCIAARNREKLEVVKINCLKWTPHVLVCVADVSSEDDCRRVINDTIKAFGQIDILINNAGISMRAVFNDCNLDVIRKVMDINFWGMVYCTKFALPHILAVKGSVIGVSSIAGIKGLPGRTGYSASKFAMHGFLESLRIENMKTGLHVLLACPGYTSSNIRNTALGKSGESQSESPYDEQKLMPAAEVAKAIFTAAEKRKHYLYLTFQGKMTLFLSRFFPALLDRLVYNKVASEKDSPFK